LLYNKFVDDWNNKVRFGKDKKTLSLISEASAKIKNEEVFWGGTSLLQH